MIQPRREDEAGLTLVEMLVALMLFSLIGVAGFAMLDTVLRVRAATEGRLEQLARIDRTLVLFSRDLQQSDPNSLITDSQILSMSRVGAGNMSYLVVDGALARRLPASGFDQVLIEGVTDLAFRALDSAGVWHDGWPIEVEQSLGLAPSLRAIELRMDVPGGAVSRLVDVPSGSGR